MESIKVPVNGKSIILKNGVELTYCEFGEENKEVIIVGQYYFITFHPWLKAMSEKYHVYGIVMRMNGPATEYHEDGNVWWNHQWAEDIYNFAQEMGIEKFSYVGKCHGTYPGWALIQKHPEVLNAFVPISFVPAAVRLLSTQNFMSIFKDLRFAKGERAFVEATVRKQENVDWKLEESASVVPAEVMATKHQDAFEEFESFDEVLDFCKGIDLPMMLLYSTDDPGYDDWKEAIYKMSKIIKGLKVTTLQGEKHFFEIDIPERVASEVCFFLDELKKNYN